MQIEKRLVQKSGTHGKEMSTVAEAIRKSAFTNVSEGSHKKHHCTGLLVLCSCTCSITLVVSNIADNRWSNDPNLEYYYFVTFS